VTLQWKGGAHRCVASLPMNEPDESAFRFRQSAMPGRIRSTGALRPLRPSLWLSRIPPISGHGSRRIHIGEGKAPQAGASCRPRLRAGRVRGATTRTVDGEEAHSSRIDAHPRWRGASPGACGRQRGGTGAHLARTDACSTLDEANLRRTGTCSTRAGASSSRPGATSTATGACSIAAGAPSSRNGARSREREACSTRVGALRSS
jgi:hypothetical protein